MTDISRHVHNHRPRFGPQACPETIIGACLRDVIKAAVDVTDAYDAVQTVAASHTEIRFGPEQKRVSERFQEAMVELFNALGRKI